MSASASSKDLQFMITAIDSSGVATPIYNRSGTTIIELLAGPPDPYPATWTPVYIPCHTETTIALVTASHVSNLQYVILPFDAEIGDLVEVHCMGTEPEDSLSVLFRKGNTDSGSYDSAGPQPNRSVLFRKVFADGGWRIVGAT